MSEENHSTCPICGIYSDGGTHHQPFCEPIRDLQTRVTALETPAAGEEPVEEPEPETTETPATTEAPRDSNA